MTQRIYPRLVQGRLIVPASKSDAQRSLVCAMLANGKSTLTRVGESADVLALMNVIRQCGAQIEGDIHGELVIHGIGELPKKLDVSVGESGLALRMISGVFAMSNGDYTVTGSGSLLGRSHRFLVETLRDCGASVSLEQDQLPIHIRGRLNGGDIRVDGSESSQHITGLIIAYAWGKIPVLLTIHAPSSSPYLDMTIHTLKEFGVEVYRMDHTIHIPGNTSLQATNYVVEGDWSAASYGLIAAALGHDIIVSGLSSQSKQADMQLLTILSSAACQIDITEQGISVDGTQRQPLNTDLSDCPDLFPAAVAYAASTIGHSLLRGVHRLRNKESDRAAALQMEYAKLGIEIDIVDDEMHITGSSIIQSATVDAHGDHRIAMALAVTALNAQGPIDIYGAEHVHKSFPDFWQQWSRFTAVSL